MLNFTFTRESQKTRFNVVSNFDDFEQGNVVKLKSGGKKMTVKHVNPDAPHGGHIKCEWMLDDGTLRASTFQPAQIEHVDAEE